MKWILTQDRKTLLPVAVENIRFLRVVHMGIKIEYIDTDFEHIGTFHNDEQAKEVLEELMYQLNNESDQYIEIPPCECSGCRKERENSDE